MARTVKCVRLVEANALMHTIANHRSIGFRLTSPSIWTSLTRPSGSITAVDIVDLDITVPKASATSRCLPIDKISTTNNRPSSSYLRVLRETRQNKPERERGSQKRCGFSLSHRPPKTLCPWRVASKQSQDRRMQLCWPSDHAHPTAV